MKIFLVLSLMLVIVVLLGVAYFTLLERKVLGYIHFRKGPNKVFFIGLFQPVLDGVKLFIKENYSGFFLNKMMFNFFPLFLLFLMFLYWMVFNYFVFETFLFSVLFFMLISGVGVYGIFGSGWSSNSGYSLLGCYRSIAQVISYEVSMVFIIVALCYFLYFLNINFMMVKAQYSHLLMYGCLPLFLVWFVVILAELNRAPFDFAESESELVSGYNVEYGAIKFAFFFLSEYGNMIFLSYFSGVLFLDGDLLVMGGLMFLMIWVRGVFPRFRYDNLMILSWKVILPLVLFCFYFFYLVVLIFY